MRKLMFFCLTIAAFMAANPGKAQQVTFSQAAAQAAAAREPLPIIQVAQNAYYVDVTGGNTGVIVGDKGVIVFDTKTFPHDGERILKAIATVTTKPVTTVILSHSDLDHVGGIVAFPKGIRVIATENCKKELEAAIASHAVNAPPAAAIPTQLLTKEREELTIEGVKLVLIHTAPAHTSGDLFLYLPKEKIVFGGDLLTLTRVHALVHAEKGGTSEGLIAMTKALLDVDADQYVAGHGGVIGKPVIIWMLDDIVSERNQVLQLIKQDKSLREIEKITGDPTPDEAIGYGPVPPFPSFAEVVYNETTKKTK
jgi:glyoxylase-like metal-dependent hydrolase (beta-lactamase superfamily II)